jgi:hypothetical protein
MRTQTRLSIMGALVLAACVGAGTARADTVAINLTGSINPPGGALPFNYTQGSYLMGFVFRVNSAISITQLGFYDSNLTGVPETFASSAVGVYDMTTNTLLTSATVLPSAPATGLFRYVSISPLTLNTSHTYAIVGVSGTNYYTVGVQASAAPADAAITYVSTAYYTTGTTTLVEPNNFSQGNIFGNTPPPNTLNDFGPNFQFTAAGAVPPPPNHYFSQLAFAGGWQMTLTYVNYSPQTVTCITNFFSDAGGALAVPFSGGTVSSRTDILQPGQSMHDQSVANLNATVSQGWAQAACDGPVQASLLYRLYTSGVPVGEAGVNAETAPTTEFATFAQTATGVAYANPSTTQSAAVTIKVFNAAGASLGSTVITLGPLAHGAANLGPLLGLQSFTGFVKVTSTIPIISLSLNFEAFPVFSSLPPGDLPSSTTLVN